MILNFSPKAYTGSPLPYLMAEQDSKNRSRPVPPRVLQGDPAAFEAMLATMHARRAYSSYHLSWREPLARVGEEHVQQILAECRAVLYPGVKPHHVTSLAVLHDQQFKFHVHVVDLRLHLPSGRQLTTFYSHADFYRIKLWQESVNQRFGCASPDQARAEISAPNHPTTQRQHVLTALRDAVTLRRRENPAVQDDELLHLLVRLQICIPATKRSPARRGTMTVIHRWRDRMLVQVAGLKLIVRGELVERRNSVILRIPRKPSLPMNLENLLAKLNRLTVQRHAYLTTRLPVTMLLDSPALPWSVSVPAMITQKSPQSAPPAHRPFQRTASPSL